MTDLVTRLAPILDPDPRRVVLKLFVPGEDDAVVHSRAAALIERIAGLPVGEIDRLLRDTLERFGGRHRDLASTFLHHYDLIRHRVARSHELTPDARILVGAYFSHEYAVEAAALCNPSMVEHLDQTGLERGQLRVLISLRQIGEGHLSSIGFVTAVIGPGTGLVLTDRGGPLLTGRHQGTRHQRDPLAAGLADDGWDNEVSATLLAALPEQFEDADLERAAAELPAELYARTNVHSTLERVRRETAESYALVFPPEIPIENRVLWPTSRSESNGMEDARFVVFTDADGDRTYEATYTAYDGRHIGARLLRTRDLCHFDLTPMRGPAARNKGMALFPRAIGGRRLALCRSDGESMSLTELDHRQQWTDPVPLHTPRHGWELIQSGNCGSPLETEAGWLVLTHGVGPMRRYAIGALLLDLDRPERVIAELPAPLMVPSETERDGYVPNVVYSCGGLIHDGAVWLPYGMSDARIGFATIPVQAILDTMRSPTS